MSARDMLAPATLVAAYAQGLFPMDSDGRLRWYSPDPRAILPLDEFHCPRTLRQLCRQGRFEIRRDTAFEAVLRGCAADRVDGTWISPRIVRAYLRLHGLGLAHSVEAWRGGQLAGGLYGVALGGVFFGESMFHRVRDASKVALVGLVDHLREQNFSLLDVQFQTPHLARFGVVEIPRDEYLALLSAALSRTAQW
ncbi:MAG: leucyl/phenylalanyl-tRNA--protein transferase [Phycisphaerae bacterium]